MAVFTFSTKGSRPADTEKVQEIKEYCDERGINFSYLVLKLLKQWHEEFVSDDVRIETDGE